MLIAVLALAACGGPTTLKPDQQQAAELGARQYAERAGADFVACSGQDSDKDGYVSCSIKSRANPGAMSEILCSYKNGGAAMSAGCKRKA